MKIIYRFSGPPVENTIVDASDVTGTKATVSFDEVTSLKGTILEDTADVEYKICPKDKPDGPGCLTGNKKVKGSTSFEVDGLTPNTDYVASVFVKNPANDRAGPVSDVPFETQTGTGKFFFLFFYFICYFYVKTVQLW